MKKSSIALYAAAALFLVCSFTFLPDKIAEFVSGVAIAAVLAFFGYRQQKKPAAAKEEEAPVPAPQSARTNESDFPFSIKINGASISVSDAPTIEAPVNNIYDNEVSAAIVRAILEENGVDVSSLKYEETSEYLKIVTADIYKLCFCRLKFSGQSHYIELTISAKDGKTLADDPRFAGIDVAKKRFTRIPVSGVEDVRKYEDVIYLAYVWGTTTA